MNSTTRNIAGNGEAAQEHTTSAFGGLEEGMSLDFTEEELNAIFTDEVIEAAFAEISAKAEQEAARKAAQKEARARAARRYDPDDDDDYGYSAEGWRLNSVGLELGLDGCALSDDERDCFCR